MYLYVCTDTHTLASQTHHRPDSLDRRLNTRHLPASYLSFRLTLTTAPDSLCVYVKCVCVSLMCACMRVVCVCGWCVWVCYVCVACAMCTRVQNLLGTFMRVRARAFVRFAREHEVPPIPRQVRECVRHKSSCVSV